MADRHLLMSNSSKERQYLNIVSIYQEFCSIALEWTMYLTKTFQFYNPEFSIWFEPPTKKKKKEKKLNSHTVREGKIKSFSQKYKTVTGKQKLNSTWKIIFVWLFKD